MRTSSHFIRFRRRRKRPLQAMPAGRRAPGGREASIFDIVAKQLYTEAWLSGRKQQPAKLLSGKLDRRFESFRLRYGKSRQVHLSGFCYHSSRFEGFERRKKSSGGAFLSRGRGCETFSSARRKSPQSVTDSFRLRRNVRRCNATVLHRFLKVAKIEGEGTPELFVWTDLGQSLQF